MKKSFKKVKVNSNEYVNLNTGEPLADEIPNITSVNAINEDLVILDSENYYIIDNKVMAYIEEHFNPSDIGRITMLARMAKTSYSTICDEKGIPHDHDSLAIKLDYEKRRYREFMSKLYRKGIIGYFIVGSSEGSVYKILLNPTFARSRKTFEKDCLKMFPDLTKGLIDLPQSSVPKYLPNKIRETVQNNEE